MESAAGRAKQESRGLRAVTDKNSEAAVGPNAPRSIPRLPHSSRFFDERGSFPQWCPSGPLVFCRQETDDMAYVRKLDVGSSRDNPNEIVVSVWIPRATNDLRTIDSSLPELQRELATRWPVKSIRLSRRMRNPAHPTYFDVNLIVGMAKPLLEGFGTGLGIGLIGLLREKFPGSKAPENKKKRRSPRRAARASKKKKR